MPAGGKSGILQLLLIGQEFGIPAYVVFDADGNEQREGPRGMHERDNRHLLTALEVQSDPFPNEVLSGNTYTVWPSAIGGELRSEIGDDVWEDLRNEARQSFDPGVSLEKNPLFVAETLRVAWDKNNKPGVLIQLAERLVQFAGA